MFIERVVEPELPRFRAQGAIDRDVWLQAGASGFLGLGVPEELGGSGIDDFRFNTVLNEELARTSLALASAAQVHLDIVMPYVLDLATPERRAVWLPKLCSGQYL